MAVLDPNQLLAQQFEPILKFRARLDIGGIPAFLVKSFNAPGFDNNEVTIDYINVYFKVKGKTKFQDMSITLYAPVSPSGWQAAMEWERRHHEEVTGRDGYAGFYKQDLTLSALGPAGDVVGQWIIKGAFIKSGTFGDFDWSDTSNHVEIKLTLAYDYATLVY